MKKDKKNSLSAQNNASCIVWARYHRRCPPRRVFRSLQPIYNTIKD